MFTPRILLADEGVFVWCVSIYKNWFGKRRMGLVGARTLPVLGVAKRNCLATGSGQTKESIPFVNG